MIAATLLLLLAQVETGRLAATPVERLHAKTPVTAVNEPTQGRLAGRYTSTSKELGKLIGGFLSGDDLYLFPDGTYIYCEWADVMRLTVVDKGTWAMAGGFIELRSDPEVTWDPVVERRYVAVCRASRSKEILLVGVKGALPRFEEDAGDDPAFMLLIVAKKREERISPASAAKRKAALMRDAWRPEECRKGSSKESAPGSETPH